MSARIRPAYAAAFIAFVVTALVSHLRATPYNNYVLLAQALLGGHAWIYWPGSYIDALPYNGLYFVIEGPLPALLLMPLVTLFGSQANQTALAVVLAAVAIGAAWELGERFGVARSSIAWICAFLLAGTDLLWCAMLGDVWFTAHVSAVCFTLLALVELAGKRRGWLVALFAACAFESRFSMIAALPVYLYLLLAPAEEPKPNPCHAEPDPCHPEPHPCHPEPHPCHPERSRRTTRAISFIAVLIPIAILWILYNEARWGTWSDIGYTAWYHQDQVGMPTGSPFRVEYLPYQLWSFFVQLPTLLPGFPWLRPEFSGVALTWTSPALLLAFFARSPARWVLALWAAAVLVAIPNFLYYVNGFAQFGMRHALDFEPFLVALMMLAVRQRMPIWGKALVAYSIAVGLWGCWYWQTFVRT
ncbi:MAG: hypothetical protein ABSD52_00665 [Candidatus Cybelea sp.]